MDRTKLLNCDCPIETDTSSASSSSRIAHPSSSRTYSSTPSARASSFAGFSSDHTSNSNRSRTVSNPIHSIPRSPSSTTHHHLSPPPDVFVTSEFGKNYDSIIQDQLDTGIICKSTPELVRDLAVSGYLDRRFASTMLNHLCLVERKTATR